MDFWNDLSQISSTPIYPKHKQESTQRNKNVKFESSKGKKDEFDDLLDNLMSKEQMKKSRKNIEPYSSQNLGIDKANDIFGKTAEKFNVANTETDLNLNYGLSRQGNKASKKSILDDLMSEDNKSYKSGVTGRRDNQINESFNFNKNLQQTVSYQPSQTNVGSRAGMRPPLKKKAESREPSIFNDDNKSVSRFNENMGSIEDLELISNTPRMPKRHTVQPQSYNEAQKPLKFQLSASKQKQKPQFAVNTSIKLLQQERSKPQQKSTIQQPAPIIQEKIVQKVITIKQDNKQLTARHQEQLKLVKQSYERQISTLKQNYEKILKQEQNNRKMLGKTYEETIQMEKKKWEKMLKDQTQRIKSLYEWEANKKTQSYQIQVRKLKQLIETLTKSQSQTSQTPQTQPSTQQAFFELTIKLKQLQQQRQRLQQQKLMTQTRRFQLESQQHQFQLYRRRQQNKLNQQKKKLFQYQTEVRKREVQIKKDILSEKQSLAAELVNNQLALSQARQNIRHENQKLNLERELFVQQKAQYEKINNKILNDLRERQRLIETEKEELNDLQVQLYKKINTIEMVAVEKGISSGKHNQTLANTMNRKQVNRSISYYEDSHKENYRNRINSELDTKIAQTKNRYAQMEQIARNNSAQKQSLQSDGPKIHLEKYIQKLTKDKLKLTKG